MRKGEIFAIFVLAILLAPIVNASFTYNGSSIKDSYIGGDKLQGTVRLNFSNEPATSILSSSIGGSIKLIDFIQKHNFIMGTDYRCNNQDCLDNYKSKDVVTSLSLSSGERKVVGLRLTGSNPTIESLSLSFESDASASCSPPLIFDVLNQNQSFIQNLQYKESPCEETKTYGCFKGNLGSGNYQFAEIGSDSLYCEKINLLPAPGYFIGAKIKDKTQGEGNLSISLFDEQWSGPLAKCNLPKNTQETQEVGCIANYSSSGNSSYYACVSRESGNADYQIRFEQSGEICGSDDSGNSYDKDFEVFAESLQFASGNITVNETTFSTLNSGESLKDYLNSYIQERYGSNCTSECIIPFGIKGVPQTLTLAKATMKYKIGNTVVPGNTQIYTLESASPTINSGFLDFDLAKADFFLPLTSQTKSLSLTLGGRNILSKPVSISIKQGFNFEISPKYVLPGINTIFSANYSKVISSSWIFDNDSAITSPNNNISKILLGEGEHRVDVELTTENGSVAKKKFIIYVGDINSSITFLLNKYNLRINNLTSSLNSLPSWLIPYLREKVNVTSTTDTLSSIKEQINNSEGNLSDTLLQLANLNVPYSISTSESGDFPLSINFDKIDTSYIEEISNLTVGSDKKDSLKSGIINWINDNYQVNIHQQTISVFSDSVAEELLTRFVFNVKKIGTSSEEKGLIINYPKESIVFKQDYAATSVLSGTYIPVKEDGEIEFYIPASIKVTDLGAYLSPQISAFNLIGDIKQPEKPTFPVTLFTFGIIIVIIVLLIIYIILQEWYKKHYEQSLFKNPDEVYNILTFIQLSREGKIDDGTIKKKLSENKWTGEQISYAFKKIDGKRTGLPEIPLFRSGERKKMKEEIDRRREDNGNARFIKRPLL